MKQAIAALLTVVVLVVLAVPFGAAGYAKAAPPSDSADWICEGNQYRAHFGNAVATAGDVNGDGYDDVIVGSMWYSGAIANEGRAFVYYGSADGLSATPAWWANGGQYQSYFGVAVGSAGDVNGDGYDDVIVGACYYNYPEDNEGRAFVYYGSADGLSVTPAWTAEGNQAGAFMGVTVGAAGDVNGDGYDDVVVGAYYYDNGQTDEGCAFVYYGSSSGLGESGTPANADWFAEGDQTQAYFATSVSSAGDVNADGFDDVIIGAYGYDSGETDEGCLFVYYGSASGLGDSGNPANAHWTADSNQADARLGECVGAAGDVNGDGCDDVMAGAYHYANGQANEGRAFVYLGSSTGLEAAPNWTAESNEVNGLLGGTLGTAGDVNGDGCDDVIIGRDYYGVVGEGRALLYYGSSGGLGEPGTPDNADWSAASEQAGDCFPVSVGTAGDVNGDGADDVIAGAYMYDGGEQDEGRAYVYYGSGVSLPSWAEEFSVDTNTVALWHFNEGAETTATDASVYGHDGTLIGPTWVNEGLGGSALDFGTGKYVEVPDNTGSVLDGMDELTIEAWVYMRSYPPSDLYPCAPIVAKWGPGYKSDDSYKLYIQDTGQLTLEVSSGLGPGDYDISLAWSTDPVPLNQWTLVKGTWRRLGEIHLFLNNVESAAIPYSGAGFHTEMIRDTSQAVWIGYEPTSDANWFDGMIDEIRISNIARTGGAPPSDCAQVAAATGTGTVTLCKTAGAINNLTAVEEDTIPASGKPSLVFAHGFFEFKIAGLTPGQSVTLTITLPSAVPTNAQYWKYGPTPGNTTPHWYQMTMGDNDGDNVVTITLVDGGLGDDDLTADGTIIDQGGPGWPGPSGGGSGSGVPAFPSIYIGIGAALGAGVLAYFLRRRLIVHN